MTGERAALDFKPMSTTANGAAIRLRGVRHNNLKNFDLDLPLGRLIVVTGLSGSGKSSLAFDTLYAEGQRRYIETFSPYARQFFDRMDKPQVDSISGIPPAIALEQRNAVKSTRSTVGTMTEVTDYMKVLWPHLSTLHCRRCGGVVRKDAPQQVWEALAAGAMKGTEVHVTFDLPISEKLSLEDSLSLVAKQGFQRLWVHGKMVRVDEAVTFFEGKVPALLTIIQDRLIIQPEQKSRAIEAFEQAYHFGKGKLRVVQPVTGGAEFPFSRHLHCARCDLEYRDPTPAMFSFNNPVGACPTCRGFGRSIHLNYQKAIPDHSISLEDGAIKPFQTEAGEQCQNDLVRLAKKQKVSMKVPYNQLSPEQQLWVMEGDPNHVSNEDGPAKTWYGVKGYFKWLEGRTYKMHVRVLLSRYRDYVTCTACGGARFQPESLLYVVTGPDGQKIDLATFYAQTVRQALRFIERESQRLDALARPGDPVRLALHEVRSRLGYLDEVGLGYLTIDRQMRTLSGGETERVNLTTCLGSRLVNTLFVLDEPSVGLHPRDTQRLIRILERLRNAGNTIVVVEHESSLMRAADRIIDIGPGHGAQGGHVVFEGKFEEVLASEKSLTGAYLSGRRKMEDWPAREIGADHPSLVVRHATLHNLRDVTVRIPLHRMVCVTGVSGSGKSTLVRHILEPALSRLLATAGTEAAETDSDETTEEESADDAGGATQAELEGADLIGGVVMVDQSSLGRTPRSNPAVYIGAFEHLRDFFAASKEAKEVGLDQKSVFSFNSAAGQCERCRGAGFEKIEMQFLSDIFIRCPDCQGRRYRAHVLEVRVATPDASQSMSIGDLLEASVDEAVEFLAKFEGSKYATRAEQSLRLLQEVGLGYVRLGQPINTLSGGESQRLKLVRHLASFTLGVQSSSKPTLFIFDEPTTGLHFEDVRVLLRALQKLVQNGHSVMVVEHNLQVIAASDWVIDLGPEAGEEGGRVVAEGPPAEIMRNPASITGQSLREEMENVSS